MVSDTVTVSFKIRFAPVVIDFPTQGLLESHTLAHRLHSAHALYVPHCVAKATGGGRQRFDLSCEIIEICNELEMSGLALVTSVLKASKSILFFLNNLRIASSRYD